MAQRANPGVSGATRPASFRASFGFLAPLSPCLAVASSPDAGEEFHRDIRAKSLAAVGKQLLQPKIQVDPFGSRSCGLALVSGMPKGGAKRVSRICVYDKKAKAVELGEEMAP